MNAVKRGDRIALFLYSTDEDRLAEFGHPAKRVALRLALRSTDAG